MKRFVNSLIVSFITTILFAIGAYWLIEKEIVQFKWTNQYLRKRDYNRAKEAERKVLILGDSQLEKWSFEHSLYKDMKRYFEKNDIGYLNVAHYGFGPIEYENQLKEAVKFYKPDILLLFYYAGNDLGDVAYRVDDKPLKRTYPVIIEEDLAVEKTQEIIDVEEKAEPKLEDQFDWGKFKEQGMDDEIIDLAKSRIKHPNDLGYPFVNPHLLNLGSYKPNNLYENCTLEAPGSKYGWYLSLQHFESIMRIADSIQYKVGIIVIPSNVQVDTSHYSFYRRAKFIISDDLLFANAPQKVLYDFCKASEIEYLDLLPFFKTHKNSDQLYIINDDHLSEQGHQYSFTVTKERMLDKLITDTSEYKRNRKKNFFENFQDGIIENQMALIKQDTAWFKDIVAKSEANGITVERQLYIDAVYILDNY